MKLWKCICLVLAIVSLSVLDVSTSFASTTGQSDTKRYIVKFNTKNIDRSQVIAKHSGEFRHQFNHINAAVVNMTEQGLTELQKDLNVDYIEEDIVLEISSTSYSNWGVSDIQAPASWQSGLTGKGVKIAVIDTGAGPHANLIVAGGTNVVNGSMTTSYADDNGHGTHVTGIIAAQGLNGGVEGVAPGASVFAVKALNSSGSGYTSDIISGIDWAIDNEMDIINMSLGSSESSKSLKNAVDTAYKNGLLVVAAAGNDGNSSGSGTNVEYPANYESVIAVAAVDSTHKRASFSATGSKVEVSAPGVNIISTYSNGRYTQMSGTSMATPFVAGDLALLKQEYPNYSNVQLRQLLDDAIVDLGAIGRDSLYGYGLIIAPSKTTTVSPTAPTITTQPTDKTVTIGGTTSLTVVATGTGTLSYQWYSNTTDSNSGGTIISSKATSSTYVVPTAAVGETYYYCVVTNTINASSTSTTSESAIVEVYGDVSSSFEGSEWAVKTGISDTKEWTVVFSKAVDTSTLKAQNIFVTDSTGKTVPVTISAGSNDKTAVITPNSSYQSGQTYYLFIRNVYSTAEDVLDKTIRMMYTIK